MPLVCPVAEAVKTCTLDKTSGKGVRQEPSPYIRHNGSLYLYQPSTTGTAAAINRHMITNVRITRYIITSTKQFNIFIIGSMNLYYEARSINKLQHGAV